MATGYNKVILIGNLGDEPQMRTSANGSTTIANFSLAVNEFRRNMQTGESSEYTEWVRCVAFGRVAETIGRFLHKGSQVHVEGKIRTSSYEKDGQKRYSTEVVLDPNGLIMLGSRQNSNNDGNFNSVNRQPYGQNGQNEVYGSTYNNRGNYNRNQYNKPNYNNSFNSYNNGNSQDYRQNSYGRDNFNSSNFNGYNQASGNSSFNQASSTSSYNQGSGNEMGYKAANTMPKDTSDPFAEKSAPQAESSTLDTPKEQTLPKEPQMVQTTEDDLPF